MRLLALVSAVSLMLVGCAPAPAAPTASPIAATATPTPAPVTVKYGQIGGVSDAAIFIADAKGFFKAEGIIHEPQPFGSAAQMIAPLGTGELAVGGGAPSAGLFNAVERGVQVRIVADKGSLLPGHGYEAIIVRKSLAERVKSAKDMKGLKISIAARDVVPEYSLDQFLRTGGLTIKDVEVVPLAFPDMITALAGGSIDVAAPIEPHVTRILEAGIGMLITRTDVIVPNEQTAVILYSEKFAQQRDVAVSWMTAYIQGARFFNDAFDKKDPEKRKEAIEILSKATKLDAALFEKMVLPGLHFDGKVNVESLAAAQQYFVAKGSQPKAIDLAKVVDLSFAEEAVRALGPYR
jgi:NitT/TauT family transport system substrate-binding protein